MTNTVTSYSLSVIIPAYNEEDNIAGRIENLLQMNYPADMMEIIVASDGSTDSTVDRVKQYEGVRILEFQQNRGRAMLQNDSVAQTGGEILIFSDAATKFTPNALATLVSRFNDDAVGCVIGNLGYITSRSNVSDSEGLYWKYEKELRSLESDLGLLATGTGACMAVRKNLWRDLTSIDDCDFTTPLDVILQNKRVVFESNAIAYDSPATSVIGEIRTRIRQTSKNLIGTLRRWRWKEFFNHPIVSWGLISHKILRWFTAFFLLGALGFNIFLANQSFYLLLLVFQLLFYLMAMMGMVCEIFKIRAPLIGAIFSFCVANIGMAAGVIIGAIGRAPSSYKTSQ